MDAASGEQDLDEPLGREAARVEDDGEEARVVDIDAVERLDLGVREVIAALERLFGAAAVDEMVALVVRDPPVEWCAQPYVDR
jgi:hypothetical protein